MTPSDEGHNYDSFVASQLTPAAASSERQEDEQPPVGESWRRRMVRKAADAAIEMLTSLLP